MHDLSRTCTLTNKKALELPISSTVVLILTIIIFLGGITLTYKFFGGAEEIKTSIERSTQEQIETLLKTGNTLTAIPTNKITLQRGQQKTLGLGIRNVGTDDTFSIQINFDNAYDKLERQIEGADPTYITNNWLGQFQTIENIPLAKNNHETIPLAIKAANNIAQGQPTPAGTYVFNLCIHKTAQPTAPCQLGQDTSLFYDKKIHQIFVEIK